MTQIYARLAGAFLCFVAAATLLAQTPTGSIEGTITDPTGAAVPGATVKITSPSLGTNFTLTTNASGFYAQRNLQPGNYDISVEASGFSTYAIKGVKVDAGAVYNGSAAMQIGGTSAVVEVSGEVASVDTVRQTVDSVITQTEIKNLPLISRNFLDLASLTPGTIVRDGGAIDPTKSNAYRTVGIDGRSGTSTRVQIDGIDITDETVGTTTANLSDDAVQEFQVQRSSLDLSTSLTSSGAVSIISKSGTNQLHGTSFFDYTNDSLQARINYLASSPNTERKRYGAGAGGALIKDKLFVYGNLEKSDQLQGQTFVSGTFPQFNSDASLPLTYQYAFGKLDYNITSSIRAFYSFLHSDDLSTGGSPISPYQNVDWTNVHTLGLTIGRATTTHDIRFGYMNFNNHIDSSELKFPFPRLGGVPYQLNISDVSAGPNGLAPQQTYQDNYQASYDGSWLKGTHTIRFGADVRRIILGGFANFAGPLAITAQYDATTIGNLQAAGLDTRDPMNYPLQDFSTGPNSGYFTIRPAHNLPHGGHYDTRIGSFIGDSWKVTRNFTLNLGVRWQYDTTYFGDPSSPRDPLFDRWIPGSSKHPQFPWDAFSPSIGFAWDTSGQGKTVIRGGFYRAYEMNINNNTFYDEYASIPAGIGPDVYTSANVQGPDGTPINIANHPTGDYSDLVGQPLSKVLPIIVQVDQALKAAYANYKYNPNAGFATDAFRNTKGAQYGAPFPGDQYKIPYSLQWNIGVQHQLKNNLIVSADFLYNHGVGLPFALEDFERRRDARYLNVANARAQMNSVLGGLTVDQYIAANPGASISDFGLFKDTIFQGLYPDFLRDRMITGGFTKYYALQLDLRGRLGDLWKFRGNEFNLAYSLGRSEATGTNDTTRAEFISSALNNRNPNDRHYFGPTSLDHRHTLTISNVTTLPLGFRVNTVTSLQSSTPISLFMPNINTGGSNSIFSANLKGDGPHNDNIPSIDYNQFGRGIPSFSALDQQLEYYNKTWAGTFTPAGQALINAGLFTPSQLVALGATAPMIPLVDPTAPNPFHLLFTTNVRFDRPVHLHSERVLLTPYFEANNVFNHAPMGEYGGLGTNFGDFNFTYNQPGQSRSDLAASVGRLNATRLLNFGIRLDF